MSALTTTWCRPWKVVVLQHLLEPEHAVGLRAAPLGGVDGALLQRRQDVPAAHGHRGDADVLVGLAGNAGRGAEAVLAEVVHRVDRLLEPAQRFRPDRLQHEALDVDAHLLPELVVELLAAAVQEPRHERDVVDPDPGSGDGRSEQHGGGMLARPVVGPGEAALDQPGIDGVQGFLDTDHGAGRQDFDLELAVGQRADVRGELVEHVHFVGLGRNHRLHPDLHFGDCRGGGDHRRGRKAREPRRPPSLLVHEDISPLMN